MRFNDDNAIRVVLRQIDEMIVHAGGHLVSVFEKRNTNSDECVGLILIFTNYRVVIAVRPEDDSVSLFFSTTTQTHLADFTHDASGSPPWREAVGKSLIGFCILLNNRGYTDGVQLEFSNHILENSILWQLTGIASRLCFRHVSDIA